MPLLQQVIKFLFRKITPVYVMNQMLRQKSTLTLLKENSNSSEPYSKYTFSENTEDETEDDNNEDDNVTFHNFKLLFGYDQFKQGCTNLVDINPYNKNLPLYILFHSWKTHLI
jgi:hypothetical protein